MTQLKKKASQRLKILGVMTGTSCDGLDAACLEIDAEGWKPLWSASAPFPKNLRARVINIQKPKTELPLKSWMELDRDLGNWYGAVLAKMMKAKGKRPEVIANHGQTVFHSPMAKQMGTTLQLGDASRIAHATGLTVVSQFRSGDMAAGGQGAPLVPLFHFILAQQLQGAQHGMAIHNIGGISNLTYIGPSRRILAFDTGPGNIWIDAATQLMSRGKMNFDRNGTLAAQGRVDAGAMSLILKNPYFSKLAPKSTGRDDFPFSLLLSKTKARGTSLIATATAITIESIAQAYEKQILKKDMPLRAILLCGGGAENPVLVNGLKARLPEIQILKAVELGIDGKMVEAQAFAFFGYLSLIGHPLGGSWTGVNEFGPPGHITPGKNWPQVAIKLKSFLG